MLELDSTGIIRIKSPQYVTSFSTRHMLIGAALNAGQGWKVLFVPPFIGFVTICLCVLLWDFSQENPKLVQPRAATERQTVRINRHLQATESSPSILFKPQS